VRQRNVLVFVTAAMTVASEILPIFLSNVPFALTQTYDTYVVSTRVSLGILATMVLVLGASLFVRWPHMPVDPRTIAGAAYYVAESGVLDAMENRELTTVEKAERDRRVEALGLRYSFGEVVDRSGRRRVAVEAAGADEAQD
jgi:hypothetical protein